MPFHFRYLATQASAAVAGSLACQASAAVVSQASAAVAGAVAAQASAAVAAQA